MEGIWQGTGLTPFHVRPTTARPESVSAEAAIIEYESVLHTGMLILMNPEVPVICISTAVCSQPLVPDPA